MDMRRLIERMLIAVAAVAAAGCALAGPGVSPYGRAATVYPVTGKSSSGELIAVDADSLWLLRRDSLAAFRLGGLATVNVERHRFTPKRVILQSFVVGVGTGAALTLACSSVDDGPENCGAVLPVVAGLFTAAGAILSLSAEESSKFHFAPYQWSDMRGFARFPQGMPDSARATLVVARPTGVLRR
jgi:hypothetical protein